MNHESDCLTGNIRLIACGDVNAVARFGAPEVTEAALTNRVT